MQATIISVGTELITGQLVDTNSAWLSGRLTELGIAIARHVTVGDELTELTSVLSESIHRGGWILVTGGLGPTLDDLTREALARALDAPLEEDSEALRQIQEFFARRQRSMPDSNRLQARRPRGCSSIVNRLGTAPGIRYEGEGCLVFVLPGVPAEMKAMFDQQVAAEIDHEAGGRRGQKAVLLTYGLSEAQLGESLADLMVPGRNPSVGTTASRAIISVRIVAYADNASRAAALAEADAVEVRRRLGAAVFGESDDSLQGSVARLLVARGATLATAESCTGGLLAKCLTDVPGSSGYFRQGYVTYADEAKAKLLGVSQELLMREGAVSDAVARELAVQCRSRAGVDFALSTTGIAGPAGGRRPEKPIGLVYVALAGPTELTVKKLLLGETLSREEIRDRACKAALNLMRLTLLAESPSVQRSNP